ncbi:CoA transferase subunit A [Comamonas sp. JC664]|uniref:CoA transferase subunit A n=1 Tax=Comamonas sp. JC664 TaxID=2801917 RepID=UPI003611E896
MNKIYPSAADALKGVVADKQLMAVGGFGLCGIPEALIEALRDSGVKDLTVASNNAGVDGFGLGKLLETRQIKKMIASYVGENKSSSASTWPRAGAGIHPARHPGREDACWRRRHPRLLHQDRVGTQVAEGKELREFDGETYVMERSIVADVSLVKAWRADKSGNLQFRLTARNFNPAAATCGKVCIVEVEEIVEVGALKPDEIHLPGIYVHRLVLNATPEKRIEKRTITEKH